MITTGTSALTQIKNSPADATFLSTKTVRVKLTGDGTNIEKRLHVVNFGFTLLDEGDKAYSAAGEDKKLSTCIRALLFTLFSIGNHCLVVLKESEDYDSMMAGLSDLRKEVESLKSITVNELTFTIEYFLGGDWKFLAMATGLDSASSTFACIWCKCPADQRANTTKKWSAIDTECGARTIEENKTLSSSTRSSKKFNVSNFPLFPTIPLTNVVVDNLHMFLRVSDVLIDLLIVELRRLDCVDKVTRFSSLEKLAYLQRLERVVREIGISGFSFWIGRESKKLKWRTFTGPEKLTLFKKLNMPQVFPEIENVDEIQDLWQELLAVNCCLSVRPENLSPTHAADFEKKARAFVKTFTDIYPSKHVTPYMHAMMNHVSEFMALHGSILPFTQQGMEKYNDVMTKDYFRATSHRGEQCLVQILQKQNRLELLESMGMKRQKRFCVTCSLCNTRTQSSYMQYVIPSKLIPLFC